MHSTHSAGIECGPSGAPFWALRPSTQTLRPRFGTPSTPTPNHCAGDSQPASRATRPRRRRAASWQKHSY
ncbi:hypothetical protein ACFPRL_20440 [Pseudoclavibacter helvolus]